MSAVVQFQPLRWSLWVALAVGVNVAQAGAPEGQEAAHTAAPELRAAQAVPASEPSYVLIGQETLHLLAMQRSAPAQRARWIDGDQAGRSYARYLKSFEYPIPEKYESKDEFKQ